MKQITFTGNAGTPYESPATRILCISISNKLLYNSGDYGNAGGDPTEDDETILD